MVENKFGLNEFLKNLPNSKYKRRQVGNVIVIAYEKVAGKDGERRETKC